jgi:hypothetical protein
MESRREAGEEGKPVKNKIKKCEIKQHRSQRDV